MSRIHNNRDDDLADYQVDNDLLAHIKRGKKRLKNKVSEIIHHPQLDTNVDDQELYDEGASGLIENTRFNPKSGVVGYNPTPRPNANP